jgi:hypothetical protein
MAAAAANLVSQVEVPPPKDQLGHDLEGNDHAFESTPTWPPRSGRGLPEGVPARASIGQVPTPDALLHMLKEVSLDQ